MLARGTPCSSAGRYGSTWRAASASKWPITAAPSRRTDAIETRCCLRQPSTAASNRSRSRAPQPSNSATRSRLRTGSDGSGAWPQDAITQRSYGTRAPLPRISMARSHMASKQIGRAHDCSSDLLAFAHRVRWFRRLAAGRHHAAFVRYESAFAEDLHGQVPHGFEAQRQASQVLAAQPAESGRGGFHAGNRAGNIHLRQVGIDRGDVRRFGGDAARVAHQCSFGKGVSARQRLVAEPGIGDEAARPGGAHHVAAPNRVDAQNGVADQLFVLPAHAFSLCRTESRNDPNHRYKHNATNRAAETNCEATSLA